MTYFATALNFLFVSGTIFYGVASLLDDHVELGIVAVLMPVIALVLNILGRRK